MAQDFSQVVQQLQLANRRLETLERLQKEQGTAKSIILQAAPEVAAEIAVAKGREKFDKSTGITQTDDAVRDNTEKLSQEIDKLSKVTTQSATATKQSSNQTTDLAVQIRENFEQNVEGFKDLTDIQQATQINQQLTDQKRTEELLEQRKAIKNQAREDMATAGKSEKREKREAEDLKKVNLELLSIQKKSPFISESRRKEIQKEEKSLQGSALKDAFSVFSGKQDSLFKKFFGAKIPFLPGLTIGRLAGLVAIPLLIKFLRSKEFEDFIDFIADFDFKDLFTTIKNVFKKIASALGFVADGFKDLYKLITLDFTDEEGNEVGALKFLKDNFGELAFAISVMAAAFTLTSIMGGMFLGGVFGAIPFIKGGKFNDGVRVAIRGVFTALAFTLTTLFGFMKTLPSLLGIGGAGAAAVAASVSRFGGQRGAVYSLPGSSNRFVLTDQGQFRNVATNKLASATTTASLQKGIQSGAIKPQAITQQMSSALNRKYPTLSKLARVPIVGPLVSSALIGGILLSDIDEREKAKAISSIIVANVGTLGMMAAGAALFGTGGTGILPGLGTLAGILIGGALGYFTGPMIGNAIADFIIGGRGGTPMTATEIDENFGSVGKSLGGNVPPGMMPGDEDIVPGLIDLDKISANPNNVNSIIDGAAFYRNASFTGGGGSTSVTQLVSQDSGNIEQNAYTNVIRPSTQHNAVLHTVLNTNPLLTLVG